MKMERGLKILLLSLNLLLWVSVEAKTLKVDTIKPSIANGDMTVQVDGSGNLVLGAFNGVLKASSGTVSSGNIDLTSEISGVLPVTNGGTNSATALNNNFVMISSGGSIVEDASISTTELANLDGSTENIQTALDAKQSTITGTDGDLLFFNSGLQNLVIDSDGKILTIDSGLPSWQDAPVSTTLDTKGQLQGFSTINASVGPCADDEILLYDALEVTGWKCSALPSTSPTLLAGDIIYNNTGVAAGDTKLSIGTESQLLTVESGVPVWKDAPVSLPDQTGELGNYLKTNGLISSWQNIHEDTRVVKNNLIECPSFEGCNTSAVVTVGAGIDISGEGTRTVEASAFNTKRFIVESTSAATLSYKDTYTANFNGQQMVGFCEIKTSKKDTVFRVYSDSNLQASIEVNDNDKWNYYEIPFVGGATDQYYEVYSSDTTTADIIEIDNCSFGKPSPDYVKQFDISMTDFVDYTPSVVGIGTGTVSGLEGSWSRVGDKMIIQVAFNMATAGTGSGNVGVSLPSGYTIDTSKVKYDSGNVASVGTVYFNGDSGLNGAISISSQQSNVYTLTSGANSTVGRRFSVQATVPIAGWSVQTNTIVTQDTELLSGRYIRNAAATVGASGSDILFDAQSSYSKQHNIDSYYNPANGRFTSPKNACYEFSAGTIISSVSGPARPWIAIKVNGTEQFYQSEGIGSGTNPLINVSSGKICLNKDEYVNIKASTGDGVTRSISSGEFTFFDIQEVSNSKTIVGKFENINSTNSTAFDARSGANATLTVDTVPVPFSEVKDNNNEWNGTTLTASKQGYYNFEGRVAITSNACFYAWVDTGSGYNRDKLVGCSGYSTNTGISASLYLNVGDKVQFRSSTTVSMSATTFNHHLAITTSSTHEANVSNLSNQKTKCQTKYLTADVTADGAISDLTFNNLTVGKRYRVEGRINLQGTYASYDLVAIVFNDTVDRLSVSATKLNNGQTERNDAGEIFKATGTTLTASAVSISAGNTIGGNSTIAETHATLCELPDTYVETTEF